jgi:regulation of enolase protein 1 (concanavalin A-like superfamily)
VVNQDAANYLRFQFGSTQSTLYATASVILSHNETSEFSLPITLPSGTTSLWLRAQKAGNTWTESWSPDGTNFNTAGTFTQALTAADIGPFAGNYNDTASSAPAFSTLVDSFISGTATGVPDLTVTKSHAGNFTQGQTGATYTIIATNSGNAVTSGTVMVRDTLPTDLTATGIVGTGWNCTLATLTCTRSDALAAAASYPAVTLTVNVAINAAVIVTNTATVSGGGEANTSNDTASDATTIGLAAGPPVTENFNTATLNTGLWTFLNPAGDGSFSMTGTQLQLNVPARSNHDPAFGGADNSVRVVQSIANTDFTVTVKFDSIPTQQYQFEGIVVNQDAANYLRFQFGSTESTLYATASVILSHKETSEFSLPITLPSGTTSLWLRVQKAGNTWTESWSPDGTNFNTAGSTFTQALTTADIGPFAGNYNATPGDAPAFSARTDSFVNIAQQ